MIEAENIRRFVAKLWRCVFPKKQYIFVEADYLIGQDRTVVFRVKAVNGRFGIRWLYDPCMFRMGTSGVCINDMKGTEGFGKPFSAVKWMNEYKGRFEEYNWQSRKRPWS